MDGIFNPISLEAFLTTDSICLRNTCQKRLLKYCSQTDVVGVYKHTGNVEDYTNYKEALNLATTEIRKSKRNFEIKLAGNITNYSKSLLCLCKE